MQSTRKFWAVLLFLMLGGGWAFFQLNWATVQGIGVSNDSVTYLDMAQNLLDGNGFVAYGVALTHYPPLYPMLLAAAGWLVGDMLHAARLLHLLLYAVNAALFGLVIWRATRNNLPALLVGLGVFLLSEPIFGLHLYSWSEAPFITLTLSAFLLLSLYLQKKLFRYLLFSGLAAGLAIATRYVGVVLLVPMGLALLLFLEQTRWEKLKALVVVAALAGAPITLWVARNLLVGQNAANREFHIHWVSLEAIQNSFLVFANFYVPRSDWSWLDGLALLAFGLFLLFVYVRQKEKTPAETGGSLLWLVLGATFVLAYYVMLLVSISFFDAQTPLDHRLLTPAYLLMLISLFAGVFIFAKILSDRHVWIFFLALMLVLARGNGAALLQTAQDARENGIGYNALIWRTSPTLLQLQALAPQVKIYSNGFDIVRYYTGGEIAYFPVYVYPVTMVENVTVEQEILTLCAEVQSGQALAVQLNNVGWRWYMSTAEDLLARCELPARYTLEDGVIYGAGR
jgi:4-amino-4-deoxy-L-arabinose transferase-like glycosyltransferase